MKKTKINVLVDWGKSFVDENGSFYSGTTEEQKDNAVRVSKENDLMVYLSDIHTRDSTEFITNGGLYPAHNLIKEDQHDLDQIGVEEGKTVSPQLTEKLYDLVKDKKSGLIVPRHVFFQDYNGEGSPHPAFTFDQIEETFGISKLDPEEFLDGKVDYVVNAKHFFDGTRTHPMNWIDEQEGVPFKEMNVFSLLKQKYGQGEGLELNFTGVVMGICIYQSATGAKQLFPKAKVNVIADACTHLVYEPLGIDSEEKGNLVAEAMCKQVGVGYLSTKDYLEGK